MTPPCAHIDSAHVVVPAGERPELLTPAGVLPPLRCASVLKPLLMWAASTMAPFDNDPTLWAGLAEPAVTLSENDPTVAVWTACGSGTLLGAVAELTGITWQLRPGSTTFGGVLIRADQVALAYGSMVAAADTDPVASRLLGWMRAVPDVQTFGTRTAAAGALGVDASQVGVKCGWFCDSDETVMRTHAATVTATPGGVTHVSAVLTAIGVAEPARLAYTAAYDGGREVLGMHQRVAGRRLTDATRAALTSCHRSDAGRCL